MSARCAAVYDGATNEPGDAPTSPALADPYEGGIDVAKRTPAERFWAKVDKNGANGCWLWTATRGYNGYGRFAIGAVGSDRSRYAHRVSWEWENGPIPDGMQVLHHCDNPPCVNPAHLFLGTRKDNMADMVSKGRHHVQRKGPGALAGERNPRARLDVPSVLDIRRRHALGEPIWSIAASYGLSHSGMSKVVHRVSWADVA